jgi:hypothetical protein
MNAGKFRCRLRMVSLASLACCAAACSRPTTPSVPQQLLYASLPEQHSVEIFALSADAPAAPVATIKEAPEDIPIDVGKDLLDEISIGNQNGNVKVYVEHNGEYQLVRHIEGAHTKLRHLNAMAVDQGGGLYIADAGRGHGDPSIVVFAANLTGNVLPDHIISGPHTGLTTPTGIAIDATGRTFVADHDSGKVLIFEANTRGDTPPIATIDGLPKPNRVFIDQELNLYVDSGSNHSITAFIPEGPQNWSRTATITATELQDPQGMAVDASGRVAAAIPGGIIFFAANADGANVPVQSLKGPAPFNPAGILIR